MQRTSPDLLPLREVASKTGMSYPQVWRGAAAGEFAAIKQGNRWLCIREDAERWAEQRRAAR